MSIRLRKFWLTIHRWLGLTVGLHLVLLGLSGSLLVFHHAIDEWLHPGLLLTAGGGTRRPLNAVIAAAEKASPDERALLHMVEPPRVENGVWTVSFQSGSGEDLVRTQVYVDPYTAEVTGRRVWGEYLVTWVYRLHIRLLDGEVGETIVGIVGLMVMVSLGTGLVLWWPLWRNSWRAAFAIRSGRRFHYDLHKTTGIVSALVLLVISFTGVSMIFPGAIRACVNVVSAETVAHPQKVRSEPRIGLARIDADRAAAIAQGVLPGGELKRLQFPTRADDPYVVRVRQAGEVRRSSANSRVWIDQYSGEVLAVRDWNSRSAADTFFGWQFPLHNGEAFGLAGRWIVFATGLTPGVLFVTGLRMWWRKRTLPRRQLRRSETLENASRSTGDLEAVQTSPSSLGFPPPETATHRSGERAKGL